MNTAYVAYCTSGPMWSDSNTWCM